ncbi:anaphase-promoting complex subunit 2 [Sporothrix schenckii 1099-18]|uniref:Anaphase-promoting complex subunit 2 n=1 Tax=Sporothrix schenckii 1099-18 TaxID=1397361 RepID=A0A0F2M0M2_SPOSC|nr:anaphase-promoting complex subunit 2 [Sporothrix schenckii 1099-18]KJR81701.1 anaphase-promoting complex subunit 2 [Sporothrix schenckii 1099-18]
MAAVESSFATLDDALRASRQQSGQATGPSLPNWKAQRRQLFRSVFQTDISQPTPQATPLAVFPEFGQAFGVPGAAGPRGAGGPTAEAGLAQSQDSEDLELPDAHEDEGASGGQTPRGPAGATAPPSRRGLRSSSVSFAPQPQGSAASEASRQRRRRGHGFDAAPPPLVQSESAADDQIRFDRAWHVVTARIALPSSVAVEDSFGTLAPESQLLSSQDAATETEFQEALRLVLYASAILPRATHVEDVLAWHTHQVRRHYAQHVLPMLSACTGEAPASVPPGDLRYYDHHMNVVLNSVRTLEAAFRLYFYGMMLLARGLPSGEEPSHNEGGSDGEHTPSPPPTADTVVSRFRQDVNALVANSTPEGLVVSLRIVLTRFASVILGFDPPKPEDGSATATSAAASNSTPFRRRSAQGAPISPAPKQRKPLSATAAAIPRPPADDDSRVQLLRQQMHEILVPLHNVGLAGENFQILLAEIMDEKMVEFIQLSFAGSWNETDAEAASVGDRTAMRSSSLSASVGAGFNASFVGTPSRPGHRQSKGPSAPSACIGALNHWIENHFARLAHEVLGRIGAAGAGGAREAVSLSDVNKWKEVALGRLSALRMTELFDIVLHWPQSRTGLEDLRISVTTPQRRSQLVSTFTAALRKRLLHPACSTLEILQVYVAMIRTFHALDPSNVLLSAAVGPLQFYLCQREDAVRIVVDGLLADPESIYATNMTAASRIERSRLRSTTPTSGSATAPLVDKAKLVELAGILNDPSQQRRRHVDEEELDWNDMDWVPDPIDAGTNYRRPKSEDVIGTLINALGSREAFTKEFQNIIAERLLSPQDSFAKEVKVLNLLKKRFGESSLQSCEVMIRDVQDSGHFDAVVEHLMRLDKEADSAASAASSAPAAPAAPPPPIQYRAKILSRLYWPGLGPEHFLLPRPVADTQKRVDSFYEANKSGRKLAWLNQLGQATVDLELDDRTVQVDCKTYEATVIYAFQDDSAEAERLVRTPPAQRTVPQLYEMLQMDEDLIVSALQFWASKGVLMQDRQDPERYTVIEDVERARVERERAMARDEAERKKAAEAADETPAPTTATTATAAAAPTRSKREARADDAQRTVYWQFIVGMLTNSAVSMPLAQIAMMMKMLIAEGFPWSNEELQEFLGEKVTDGELEVVGGKYRLVKK